MKKLLTYLILSLTVVSLFLWPKAKLYAASDSRQLVISIEDEGVDHVVVNGKTYSKSTILVFQTGTKITFSLHGKANSLAAYSFEPAVSPVYDYSTDSYSFSMPSQNVNLHIDSIPCLDGKVILKSQKDNVETIYSDMDEVAVGTTLTVSLENSSTKDTSKLSYKWVYAYDNINDFINGLRNPLSEESTYQIRSFLLSSNMDIMCLVYNTEISSAAYIQSIRVHPVGRPYAVTFNITGNSKAGIILDDSDSTIINKSTSNTISCPQGRKVGFYIADGYNATSITAAKSNGTEVSLLTDSSKGANYRYFTVSGVTKVNIAFDSSYDYEKVIIECPDLVYEGEKEYAPEPVVKTASGFILTKETDNYTVSVTSNGSPTKAGTYLASVIFDKYPKYYVSYFIFNIKPNSLATAQLKSSSFTYTGKAVKPEVKASYLTNTLVAGKDYDVVYPNSVNAGNYTLTVIFKGNYTGSKKLSYKIDPCTACGAKLKSNLLTYTGKTLKPTVIATDSKGHSLKLNKDYTIKYASSSKAVGKYKIKVTFKGNHSASKTLEYKIVPKGTSITKLSPESKGFTIEWKKQTKETTGYEIRYSLKSDMSSSKTKVVKSNKTDKLKITGLKAKKTYYVQIRTYKKKSDFASDWSKTMKIKTN